MRVKNRREVGDENGVDVFEVGLARYFSDGLAGTRLN
jgi:hypothetical protein